MKKIVAILLSISLILNISVTCMAIEEKNYSPNISSETYEIELSLNELEKGIDVYAIQNADGCIEIVKSNETQVNNRSASTVATFHVGLTRVQTNKGILTWNAVMPQLKKVTGTIYCKSTSGLFPTTYSSTSIICPYLDGTEGRASGGTSSFYIPSPISSFRVGYSNVYLKSITNLIYFGSGSSVVNK